MIDFRYHIVSLVAVFLALAVGVVLGAGPLRGQISETLEGQVAELGTERNALRSQLSHQQELLEDKDALIGSATPRAVADVLVGTDVTVVELPGADGDVVDEVATVLATGGAGIISRTVVLDVFDDPDAAEAREQVLADVEPFVGASTDLPGALAAAIAGVGPDGTFIEAGALGTQLQQGEVIQVTGLGDATDLVLPGAVDVDRPDLVVIVSGGITVEEAADGRAAERLQSRLELVGAVAAQTPVLLVGVEAETWQDPQTAAGDPLVVRVRAEPDLVDVVSTTDNAGSAAGQLTAAWTAAWTTVEETGHYGVAPDAQDVAPPPPPVREAGTGRLPREEPTP